jgi:hypothetical protein
MGKFNFTMVFEVALGVAIGMIVYNLVSPMIAKWTGASYEGDSTL